MNYTEFAHLIGEDPKKTMFFIIATVINSTNLYLVNLYTTIPFEQCVSGYVVDCSAPREDIYFYTKESIIKEVRDIEPEAAAIIEIKLPEDGLYEIESDSSYLLTRGNFVVAGPAKELPWRN